MYTAVVIRPLRGARPSGVSLPLFKIVLDTFVKPYAQDAALGSKAIGANADLQLGAKNLAHHTNETQGSCIPNPIVDSICILASR